MADVINLKQRRKAKLAALGLTPGSSAATATTGLQVGAAVGGVAAASAVAVGAATGSVAGPIGTAVGAVIGAVVGALSGSSNTASHIGTWDTALVQSLSQIGTANGIGRQIPWNENSHGLTQMIEALMAVGAYMAWDPSLITSYDVCAHWAMDFAANVQTVVQAMAQNPTGAQLSVPVSASQGTGRANALPGNFTFTNPGVGIGADAISAQVIMGNSGLMYWIIIHIGETQAHAASNGNNRYAQKVFALMADYVAANTAPALTQTLTPAPAIAPVVAAASAAANQATQSAPPATQGPAASPPGTLVSNANVNPNALNAQWYFSQDPNNLVDARWYAPGSIYNSTALSAAYAARPMVITSGNGVYPPGYSAAGSAAAPPTMSTIQPVAASAPAAPLPILNTDGTVTMPAAAPVAPTPVSFLSGTLFGLPTWAVLAVGAVGIYFIMKD